MDKKKIKNTATLSFSIPEPNLRKMKVISGIFGLKLSELVRMMIDSLPEIDEDDEFWEAVAQSGIVRATLPANMTIHFVTELLNLPLTTEDEILQDVLKVGGGFLPTLHTLSAMRKVLHEKSLRKCDSKQDESESSASKP